MKRNRLIFVDNSHVDGFRVCHHSGAQAFKLNRSLSLTLFRPGVFGSLQTGVGNVIDFRKSREVSGLY